jgi:hypothetical protein
MDWRTDNNLSGAVTDVFEYFLLSLLLHVEKVSYD